MKFLDFFAGIGGFRRGMESAGHECIGFCEFDKFATASYTSMYLITEKQRKYLDTLPFKKRQKEILKEEYKNGEWYANDIRTVDARSLPKADCWCFGAPCQDFSIAGKRAGLNGERSSLIREIFRLLEEQKEKDRPEWLVYENVKGMLSSNRGLDYLSILSKLDELGYDIEWQNINSAWFVPQNRERIYTIGHLRRYGRRKILPVERTDGKNNISIIGHRANYRKSTRVFTPDGITGALDTNQGGGRNLHVALPCFCDLNYGNELKLTENSRTLQARYNKGICNHKGEISGVAIPVLTPDRAEKRQNGRRFKEDGEPMFTLTAQDRHGIGVSVYDMYNHSVRDDGMCGTLTGNGNTSTTHCGSFGVMIPIKEATKQGYAEAHEGDCVNLSVPRSKTRRGRVGHGIANTLDTSCNQGVVVQLNDDLTLYAIWYEKYKCYIAIRKLTPKECFRLQGFDDYLFERAQFVNSDNQLYKQAGNSVTVPVVREIGDRMMKQ